MSENLKKLSDAGVSVWLDDLSRERITGGGLVDLIKASSVVGVTTNPTIFAAALADGESYAEQVKTLVDKSVDEAITALTTEDVRNACDLFSDTFAATGGKDGRVSIEVSPALARDTEGTIAQAKELAALVGKPEVLIKIPATKEGLPAITEVIGSGISVNVTLIFSLDRYQEVIDAYEAGLEKALANGEDLSKIQSVASFFVSRVDSEVDKRLDAIGGDATKLKGKTAVANARLAYEVYEKSLQTDRWRTLADAGANPQRPLWASTGVKNPDYSDTMYVAELIAPNTVNTMPEKTLLAFADHGEVAGDTITANYDDARAVLAAIAEAGVDLADVTQVLEDEGVQKFDDSWQELTETVKTALGAA
ncbi:transaldolase [Naumannella halotolerans]|uniref:Transaldolase n=1 Tax=Naumannella halotolerans TaxID=993414 RepID=A0A4R7J7W7_9ACTN|nr:transaldolase [Naumannella halotolerans]TDT32856.1 transaldolase [Naumannella halotolerans]